MAPVYNFQDPLPIVWGDVGGPCFDHDHNEYEEIAADADDGWPDPGPCIICGTPHTACVGPIE